MGIFIDVHLLTDEQIAQIKPCVDAGMTEGDRRSCWPFSEFTEGWQLGKPDKASSPSTRWAR